MHNVVGRIKLPIKQTKFEVTTLNQQDQNELVIFLNQDDQKRIFGRNWNIELNHRLKTWDNFSEKNFVIVRDTNKKIVAVTSFWNPIKNKQIQITKIPTPM